MDLFAFSAGDGASAQNGPRAQLAERMRPLNLHEFVGQSHILAAGSLLRRSIEQDRLHSMIFYGPPGCGKTTLAHVISRTTGAEFVRLNAVEATVKDVRDVIEQAKERQALYGGRRTILFLDEVHRFNSARQDVLLPAVEKGDIVLIGATTERPLHHVNGALLSRCTVYEFEPLQSSDVAAALARALDDHARGLGDLPLRVEHEVLEAVAEWVNGDLRRALNALEQAAAHALPEADGTFVLTTPLLIEALREPLVRADVTTQYDVLSAFHKSVRGSSADAVLWFLYGTERLGMDPQTFLRRLTVACAEDIGLADAQAVVQALTAWQAYERIGLPEAHYNIVQAIQYAVRAPKSRAVADAYKETLAVVQRPGEQVVPPHLRNR
jgi:putative ATPase